MLNQSSQIRNVVKATHPVWKINDAIERSDGMLVMVLAIRKTQNAGTGTAIAVSALARSDLQTVDATPTPQEISIKASELPKRSRRVPCSQRLPRTVDVRLSAADDSHPRARQICQKK